MNKMTETAPIHIYLQVADGGESDTAFPADHEGVTWCEDSVLDNEVPYTRADVVDVLMAKLRELRGRMRPDIECAGWVLYQLDAILNSAPADLLSTQEGTPVITTNEAGQCVCVSVQDEDGQIMRVLWEATQQEVQPSAVTDELCRVVLRKLFPYGFTDHQWVPLMRNALNTAAPALPSTPDHNDPASVAAIQFALAGADGLEFLRLWNEGEFDQCRRQWPEAPKSCYEGADPMLDAPPALPVNAESLRSVLTHMQSAIRDEQ